MPLSLYLIAFRLFERKNHAPAGRKHLQEPPTPVAAFFLIRAQEHVQRYVALRHFYKRNPGAQVCFSTEKDGPVDLVLKKGTTRLAFKFKRWQGGEQLEEITNKDYQKLTNFIRNNGEHSGYAIIFTNNRKEDCKKKEQTGLSE